MSDQCNICVGRKLGLNLSQLQGHYTILKHVGEHSTPRRQVPSDMPLEEPTAAREVKCEHVPSPICHPAIGDDLFLVTRSMPISCFGS